MGLALSGDRSFGRRLILQGAAQFAQFGVTLALMPLVIKQAGAATYGSYIVLTSVVTLVSTFLTLGAGFECRRNLPSAGTAEEKAAIFLPSMSIQFVTSCASALVLALALPLFHERVLAAADRLHPASIVFLVFSLFGNNLADDFFRCTHQMAVISKAVVARALLHPGLVLGAALLGRTLDVELLVVLQATAWSLVNALLWWRISRQIPLRFCFHTWSAHLADIRVGFPLIAAVLAENLLSTTDRYFLAAYLSPFEVGAYAAAFTIGSLVLILPRIANSVLIPALAQAVDAGRVNEAEQRLQGFLQVFVMLTCPFVFGAALLGEPILLLFADQAVAEEARWVVPIVGLAGALYGYCYLLFNALFVSRKTGSWLSANLATVVAAVGLNLLLVGWLRVIEAAALATLLSYAVRLYLVYRAGTGWALGLDWLQIGRSLLAAAGMALVVWGGSFAPWAKQFPLLRLTILICCGVSTYFVLLFWSGGYAPSRFRRALGL
jgi:O-antigen/teichoic acid export membrane protein